MGNLASRKLLMGLASVALVALNKRMGLDLSPEDMNTIITLEVTVIGSQAGIDALRTYREGK